MAGETSKGDQIKVEAAAAAGEVHEPTISSVQQRCCIHECRYNECRRNHAACSGHYVFDGCGEFIKCNGRDDVYTCAACGCHRSFHRKGPPIHVLPPPAPMMPLLAPLPFVSHRGVLTAGETSNLAIKDRNIDAGSNAMQGETETEEEKKTEKKKKKKRAKRTVLTVEQKNKLMRFADKLGWKPQKHDNGEIQQFCEEIGITKRVFTVWLNNNRRGRKD